MKNVKLGEEESGATYLLVCDLCVCLFWYVVSRSLDCSVWPAGSRSLSAGEVNASTQGDALMVMLMDCHVTMVVLHKKQSKVINHACLFVKPVLSVWTSRRGQHVEVPFLIITRWGFQFLSATLYCIIILLATGSTVKIKAKIQTTYRGWKHASPRPTDGLTEWKPRNQQCGFESVSYPQFAAHWNERERNILRRYSVGWL